MKREDIIKLVREANVPYDSWPSEYNENLERFAALVAEAVYKKAYAAGAAAEREACAKVCEELRTPDYLPISEGSAWDTGTLMCADAIRARGRA